MYCHHKCAVDLSPSTQKENRSKELSRNSALVNGFLIPFSFLLYIKFSNTGSTDNAQCLSANSPERVHTEDEQCGPFEVIQLY